MTGRRRSWLPWAVFVTIVAIVLSAVLLSWPRTHQQSPRALAATPAVTSTTKITTTTKATASTRSSASTTAPRQSSQAQLGLKTITVQLGLDDTSRPLVDQGETLASSRPLPTTVIRPATPGRYPLIVFIHGYDTSPSDFARFTKTLAREGFVVAAPSFPLEDPVSGFGLDGSDLPNEAGDVSFVITSILNSSLATYLTPGEIGVVGHSDGADAALEIGYEEGLTDPRVKVVVASAPDPIDVTVISGGPPLLLIHGTDDEIVDPSSSDQVFQTVSAEAWSLTLEGADHASAIFGPSSWTNTFDQAVDDVLSAVLVLHQAEGLTGVLEQLPLSDVSYQAGP
jgi:dienelactone hydrolase